MSNERGFPRARDLDRLWRHVADLMPVSPIVDTWAPRFMSYGTFTASKINGMMLRPSVTLFIALAALSSHNCILSLMNCRLSWVGRQSQLFSVPVQLEITLYCWQPTDGVVSVIVTAWYSFRWVYTSLLPSYHTTNIVSFSVIRSVCCSVAWGGMGLRSDVVKAWWGEFVIGLIKTYFTSLRGWKVDRKMMG